MPVINTQPFPAIASVRVGVDWADVPTAAFVTVWRVDCATGVRTQLRPYVSYNGSGYLATSCGVATFWDTEVPLDTCVYYCTQAQDAAGSTITTASAPLMMDSFTRVVANGWGTPDVGPAYVIISGVAASFSTNGSRGGILNTAAGQRMSIATGPILTNMLAVGTVYPTAAITGGTMDLGLMVEGFAGDNGYEVLIRFQPGGQLDARINRINAGSATVLTTVTNLGTAGGPTAGYTIMALKLGNQLKMKFWQSTFPEPAGWMIEIVDPAPLMTKGGLGAVLRSQAGNTNFPFTPQWDNLMATDPCDTTTTVETCSGNVTMASNGNLWLKDPVRPCNDQLISLCWAPPPDCNVVPGIFFARLEQETYGSNTSNLDPVNARRPIPVVRQRGDAESTLVLVTKMFADRDNLLTELEPGSPLLFQGPADYGMPDRYISVGNVTISRYQSDHRYEPRVANLPFVTVNRPAGPSQGICGAQVDDLCDTYGTWDLLAASGLSFQDLIDGKASPDGPGVNFRIWSEVEAGFANWLAVETAPNTWETVREG